MKKNTPPGHRLTPSLGLRLEVEQPPEWRLTSIGGDNQFLTPFLFRAPLNSDWSSARVISARARNRHLFAGAEFMKATLICLLVFFASFDFPQQAWAVNTELFASVFGDINGKHSTGDSFFATTPSVLDFDFVKALAELTQPLTASTDSASGSVTGTAFAVHLDDRKILGADLSGAVSGFRKPGAGTTFKTAGQLTANFAAIAEYRDELMIEIEGGDPSDNTLVQMDGVIFFQGFTTLEAVATGGINPENVFAEVFMALDGTNSTGTRLLARKRGDGREQVPQTADDPFNLFDQNPVVDFNYVLSTKVALPVTLRLVIQGRAAFGDGDTSHISPGVAAASFEAHYGNTLEWGGITKVTNLNTGEEITNYRVTSASGFDYNRSFLVPEPTSWLLVFLATGLGPRIRSRRR
jgi:hypothetical protein